MLLEDFCKKIDAVPMSVIEDIKTEIQQVVEEEADDERWSRGLHYALKIIDKYTGKERMNDKRRSNRNIKGFMEN